MKTLNRLKIIGIPILVAGTRCEPGDLIDVDDETAYSLLNNGQAETADEVTRARWKTRPLRGIWSDPAEERARKPVLHIVKAA